MMKKTIAIGLMSMLLLTSITALSAFGKVTSTTNEIVVPDDYPTIQEAIDHANDMDIIRVKAGTYPENIVVDVMGLQIIGAGAKVTTIDGGGNDHVVQIVEMWGPYSSVTISGFTIKNSDAESAGVFITGSHAATIKENIIRDNEYGVKIDISSVGNEIYHNNFINNNENAYDAHISIWENIDLEEGNYWDDYEEKYPDATNDGHIWDTPYEIPPYGPMMDMYPLVEQYEPNNTPNKPTCRYDKDNNELVVSTTDVDGDQIRFGVSWDNDGNVDDGDWTEFHDSGEEVRIDCGDHKGTAGVIAEDENGAQSSWDSVDVNSKAKSYPIFAKLLELFPNAFPILRALLGL